MRKFSRIISIILIVVLALGLSTTVSSAITWEFGSSGSGRNPFTPRGYLVDTNKGRHWLNSRFNNSGPVVKYTGVENGVDYLEAEPDGGGTYTFYAMTDRNPWPEKSDWIGYGKLYLAAWKDGERIWNFND